MEETLVTPAAPPRPGSAIIRLATEHAHLLRYLVIGGGAFVIDVGLFALLEMGAGLNPLIANTISVVTSMVFSFTLNALANFRVKDRLLPRFLSFLVVCGAGYLISSGTLWVLIEFIHLDPTVAKILSLPLVLIVQFVANKRVTFGAVLSAYPERNPQS